MLIRVDRDFGIFVVRMNRWKSILASVLRTVKEVPDDMESAVEEFCHY